MVSFQNATGRRERLVRPFARLPRWAAGLILLATLIVCIWSVVAVNAYSTRQADVIAERSANDSARDMDLYRAINLRMEKGEGYYEAALAEQRRMDFPTTPFVTVRSPVVAYGHKLFGATGWRVVAVALWLATIVAWMGKLEVRSLPAERIGAALLLAFGGAAAFMPDVGLVHEVIAGLLLSLALGLYRPDRWWPSLLLASLAVAVREIALPFLLLWAAFAVFERRWKELAAIAAVLALFAGGMALHANFVAEHRLAGDGISEGWTALQGPVLALYGLRSVTLVQLLPVWLGPPLLVLSLLGWAGLGGRPGLFASLWFTGFMLAVSLFARPMNFYWLALLVPSFCAGLAFAPRALGELVRASLRNPRYGGAAGSGLRRG